VFLIGQLGLRRALRKLGLALTAAAILAVPGTTLVQAKEARQELGVVSRAQLPPEAQLTEKLVRSGGPFRYAKDGSTFGNRERALPVHARGYYREYTVATPGSRNRGARRIVCGGSQPAQPDACFYTADHYASFKRIVQ
jgi:ribonuclease T1